jgi:hypothetical protein
MERRTVGLSVILIGLLAGITLMLTPRELAAPAPPAPTVTPTSAYEWTCIIADPEYLTFQQLLDQADVMFVGRVTGYTPIAGMFHDMHITVLQDLGGFRQPPNAVIAIAGTGPLDNCPSTANQDPKVGDQVIVFARRADLMRANYKVVRGVEMLSYYVLGADGMYHGGPDHESIWLEDLQRGMGQSTSAKLTPEDIGVHLEEMPAGMQPTIHKERAIELAGHITPRIIQATQPSTSRRASC